MDLLNPSAAGIQCSWPPKNSRFSTSVAKLEIEPYSTIGDLEWVGFLCVVFRNASRLCEFGRALARRPLQVQNEALLDVQQNID
jgi:hypothetical protein